MSSQKESNKDKKILIYFIALTQKHKWIKKASYIIFKASPILYGSVYALMGIYLVCTGSNAIGLYAVVPFICLVTTLGLRRIVKKQRPYAKYGYKLDTNIKRKKSYSMPSNHSASAMIIAFAVGFVNVYLGILALLVAILTGLSRVFMGLHYLSDVAAGWSLGVFFGIIGFYILAF